jgi:DNA-binding transcriptional regulator YiaG
MPNRIKELRQELGMSRAEMSRQFQIPIRTLENWDAGKNSPPEWAELLLIKELERMIKK